MNLLVQAHSLDDDKIRCFKWDRRWYIVRNRHLLARADRYAMAKALLRGFLAYGREARR
ncbi:hypothetical protein [Glutamicibacter sp. X7]